MSSQFNFEITPYELIFKEPAVTSRSTMHRKRTCMVKIVDRDEPMIAGLGECALFEGLSAEDTGNFNQYVQRVHIASQQLPDTWAEISGTDWWPKESSIRFGFETALLSLRSEQPFKLFTSSFTEEGKPISINGLVWMGTYEQMRVRIRHKLDEGFRCIKLKIGGIDFNDELDLLRSIRREFPAKDLELRLDANGAFHPLEAIERLKRLSDYHIHSIEQPIRAGQWDEMARICHDSPIPIALDEELIGTRNKSHKERLLDAIRPSYIILKPSLCGGFSHSDQWIALARQRGIGWWATSALESAVGLNAIAQWVAQKNPTMAQGLGTGELYVNDFPSPIQRIGDKLFFKPSHH